MIKNINHRECTCDLCGAKVYIEQRDPRPKGWESFDLGMKHYDTCKQCFIKVDMAIEDLKVRKEGVIL